MQKKTKTKLKEDHRQPPQTSEERRGSERRKAESDGYTYIPMVGWYCRREEARRDDDDTLK